MEVLQCFLFVLVCSFLTAILVDPQDTQSGFISIDCGAPKETNYTDAQTGLPYISDADLINGGISNGISFIYKHNLLDRQFLTLRSFPEGNRNCYILKPAQGKFNKYLIRATFMYGDYDGLNKFPVFDLHIGVDYWDTLRITDASFFEEKEIIHIPSTDMINFCLVNTGHGTPFISVLELRPLNYSMYETEYGSLNKIARLDLGSTNTEHSIRYPDDVYDRKWHSSLQKTQRAVNTTFTVISSPTNYFKPPSIVMSTAVAPLAPNGPIQFFWGADNFVDEFYFYIHYSELEVLKINQSRNFSIYLNDKLFSENRFPKYLKASCLFTPISVGNSTNYKLFINKTLNSTLPPIVSAIEIYTVKKLEQSQTYEKDVSAVMGIKSMYMIARNWQGDPCAPEAYVWVGLNCTGSNPPRIISMNLSSSGLTGEISPFLSNLTMLQTLDLSNNNLTGKLPDFLGDLESLKILNLKGNNFTGPIPEKLQEKSQHGLLSLSMDGQGNSTSACTNSQCKKKNSVPIPVVASIAVTFVLLTLLAILWIAIRKGRIIKVTRHKKIAQVDAESQENDSDLETNIRRFTYSDILLITNNLEKIIGRGGFGVVYHGKMGDTEVAVKMLLQSRGPGLQELQEEAKVPLNVHHKNLTSLVGYCIEGTKMGIIYEYMENGDLGEHLFDKDAIRVLSWCERLQIAIDAAQGLEYLHHGCNPPIVHRDIKCVNILLTGKFEAKLADFGLCKAFPVEGGTHISTINVAGTPGYLDPEYRATFRITEKSDIYSFGVVLLELITSRKAIMMSESDHINIIDWVTSLLKEWDVEYIVDPKLMGNFDVNSTEKVLDIAMECVSRESNKRPTMNHVVVELKECLAMEMTRVQKSSGNMSIMEGAYV